MPEPTPARPPIATAALSVILLSERAPGEESAAALAAWRQHLESLRRPFELILVQPQVGDAAAPEPGILVYDSVEGLGAAMRQAVAATQHPLVVFCTADRQYQPADLARLLGAIDHADVVVGFRTGRAIPASRRALDQTLSVLARILLGTGLEPRRTWLGRQGWGRRWAARWIFGLRVADPECPYRLLRREVLARIPLQSRGRFVHVETLAKANHLGCLLAEEPVSWSPAAEAVPEMYSFRQEAYALFRRPDFGPPPGAPVATQEPAPGATPTPEQPPDGGEIVT